jgi:hypothetical protein
VVDLAAAEIHKTQINASAPGFVSDHTRQAESEESGFNDEAAEPKSTRSSHPWQAYEKINIKATEELTEHQYLLMFPCIPGYALREKQWGRSSSIAIPQLQMCLTYFN